MEANVNLTEPEKQAVFRGEERKSASQLIELDELQSLFRLLDVFRSASKPFWTMDSGAGNRSAV